MNNKFSHSPHHPITPSPRLPLSHSPRPNFAGFLTNASSSRSWLFPILSLILAGLFMLDLMTGSVPIAPDQVLHILLGGDAQRASWEKIVWLFRLPKAITAILAGAGLALSGLLMQNLFRNPLAGPSVLGISAGASLGVAVIVLYNASGSIGPRFVADLGLTGKAAMVCSAGLGAGMVLAAILALARRVKDVMTLLIVGILCGFAVNAAVSVLIHFSVAERIQAYVSWTFGSFAAVTWTDLKLFVPVVLIGLTGCLLIRKPLNGLLLGEAYARSMGLRINLLRLVVIGLTALLAGTVTAFCGPVAFIGVAVPHLGRVVLGSADHRRLLPATALLGAMTALAADLLAQFPGSQAVLPLNAVTALLGAPVIVWLIVRRGNLQKTFAG
ncbi:iron chelate uptake ABC transporter family permease subunit [Desulfosarcina variabilis]|uniref:iron chelate uptake ABC transporter family permease subunit n=1 Tax=Desulfosarcina variabilis TaxID=2300 RepID=UPI003AFAD1F3